MLNNMFGRQRFQALDGVRFLAALLVFVGHFEGMQLYYRLPFHHWEEKQIFKFGAIGVTIFFVLSGFLISLVALNDLAVKPSKWLRKFYMRRILRICPLYFLIVIISFTVLQNIPFYQIQGYDMDYRPYLMSIVLFYVFMLPQIPFLFFPNVPYVNVLWSIGVEELFYVFWPLVLGRRPNMVRLAAILLLAWVILKVSALALHGLGFISQPHAQLTLETLERNRFYCFAIGGAAAFAHKHPMPRFKLFISKPGVQAAAIALIIFWLLPLAAARKFTIFMNETVSIGAAVIVLGCAWDLSLYRVLKLKVVRYLGRISYGLYCFQMIAIATVFKIIDIRSIASVRVVSAFVCSWLLTIGLASTSFHLFEKRFLKLKSRYY